MNRINALDPRFAAARAAAGKTFVCLDAMAGYVTSVDRLIDDAAIGRMVNAFLSDPTVKAALAAGDAVDFGTIELPMCETFDLRRPPVRRGP